MALLRAEIRDRLGDSSIYDGIVEFQNDFQTEPMLASMHYGSMMLCLNYTQNQNLVSDPPASDLYVKREDGSWERVITVTKGTEGKSAYEVAVDEGYVGTEQEWLASLVGADGTTFTPSVSSAGVLSWTNDGDKANPDPVDIAAAVPVSATVVASAIGDMTSAQAAQALEDLGGEPERFVVTISESGGVYSADKTYAEISAAKTAGKDLVLNIGLCTVPLVESGSEFYGYVLSADGYFLSIVSIASTDVVTANQKPIQPGITKATVSEATPTITPQNNVIYSCGELTSLTISNPPATGAYSIVFTSGSTATTTTIPATILGLESFAAEANTLYEINVLDNRAVVGSWAVSSGE